MEAQHAGRSSVVLVGEQANLWALGAAQGRGEHVGLEELAVAADHAQVLLPVELQLTPWQSLVPGVRLGRGRVAEGYVVPPAAVREGVVAGDGVAVAVEQVLVHRLLGRARRGCLLGDQVAVPCEAASAPAPAVADVAAVAPVLGDGVAVEAVAPAISL